MSEVNSTEDPKGSSPKEQFLATAMKQFKISCDQTAAVREMWLEDVRFGLGGEQWDEKMLKERAADKRPALTINRLPATFNHIVNDFRQNRPAIKVRPVDNLSDPDKADVLNGLYRRIQNLGDYKTAVDTAFQYAVVGGFGFVRVGTKYCNDGTFDQDIFVERIENPCMVYFPIGLCQSIDYSDAPWCHVRVAVPKDEFKRKYPKVNLGEWEKSGKGDGSWLTEDVVYCAEYFRAEDKEQSLVMLSDGQTVTVKEKVKEGDVVPDDPLGRTVFKVRPVMKRMVYRSFITEVEILEPEVDLPVQWIPIVPMLAQEVNIDGKKAYISLVRFAKDPQKMFNFWNTAFTEQVALAPRAPFIAAAGQVEDFPEWQTANTKNHAVLRYKAESLGGTLVPPPQRNAPPEVGVAIIQGIQFAADNIKATTGIFDASLGAHGNETSGRAINARLRQAGTGNFHFTDNASKALIHLGRIIKDWIPIIYDTPGRIVRIVGEDMTDKVVALNDPKTGKAIDLTIGEYDVIVDVGPSYETKRVETSETLLQLAQSVPAISQFAPDLLVKNLDFPLRDETSKRIAKGLEMTMPGLIEQEGAKDGKVPAEQVQQMQAQAQAQIQQMQGVIQEMNAAIEKMSADLENKDNELKVKVAIAELQAKVELMIAEMNTKVKANQQELDMVKHGSETALKIRAADLEADRHEKEAEAERNAAKTNNVE